MSGICPFIVGKGGIYPCEYSPPYLTTKLRILLRIGVRFLLSRRDRRAMTCDVLYTQVYSVRGEYAHSSPSAAVLTLGEYPLPLPFDPKIYFSHSNGRTFPTQQDCFTRNDVPLWATYFI